LDCRHHGRKQIGRFDNNIRCWNCNHVGHIVAHCYTMRCYSCGEYGHKAYNCWNSRKQLIRNSSQNMTTRVNKKIWKIKSQVPNKKDEENIAPEIDEVNNRSLGDKTSNNEYSQNKDKESSGAHNNDVGNESSTLEQQEEANFIRKLHKGSGKYKGKLLFKCFKCGKVGHFASSVPISRKTLKMNKIKIIKIRRRKNPGINETWKKKENAIINDQKTKLKKPGHSQMWIPKTEQVNMSKFDCCKNNGSHVTSIV
jgi:hypothetical protein